MIFDWLKGIIDSDYNNYNISIAQLELEKKRNEDELDNDIRNLKIKEAMSAKAFIDIDDTEENNATLDNQDIFDIVTNKIVDEPENAEEPVRTQITHKEVKYLSSH